MGHTALFIMCTSLLCLMIMAQWRREEMEFLKENCCVLQEGSNHNQTVIYQDVYMLCRWHILALKREGRRIRTFRLYLVTQGVQGPLDYMRLCLMEQHPQTTVLQKIIIKKNLKNQLRQNNKPENMYHRRNLQRMGRETERT